MTELVKRTRLQELEEVIEKDMAAFLRVGNALLEIREKELWKEHEKYNTWGEYIQERWGWQKTQLYCNMNAAYIYPYLENSAIAEFLPTNEWQMRPLQKLGTFKQHEMGQVNEILWADAWIAACEMAKPKYPTEKQVIEAVNKILKGHIGKSVPNAEIWTGQYELNKIYQADVTNDEWLSTMKRESIDFIITDPPWRPDPDKEEDEENNKYILYEALGRLAEKTLKPGGACAVYFGKLDLPILFHIMDQWLDYEWCFASYQPHSTWNFRKTQFKECWRPIAIFRKPGNKFQTTYFPDAIESRREKGYHEWQQGIEPVKLLIEKYTIPGQLILEPYCGGGTVPFACKMTGRNFIAFDNDLLAIISANERLQNAISQD